MSAFWIGFIIGMFIGANVGILVIALCKSAGDVDERLAEFEQNQWMPVSPPTFPDYPCEVRYTIDGYPTHWRKIESKEKDDK